MRKFRRNNYLAIEKSEWYEIKHCVYGIIKIPKDFIENSKDWVEIFEPKFKNGDVVKSKYSIVFITNYEKGDGYGFNGNTWLINNWQFEELNWQLATKEEWLEALTKEAVKRSLICGAKYKPVFNIKKTERIEKVGKVYQISSCNTMFYNGFQYLMKDGIWAESVKEETLEELAYRFRKYYQINNYNSENSLFNFFNENKETIHRLSK